MRISDWSSDVCSSDLEDAYTPGKAMGAFAEDAAREYQFTREQQAAYALESLARAQKAIGTGAFEREVVGLEVKTRKGVETVSIDEQPGKAQPEEITTLQPAFAIGRAHV